MMQSVAPVLDVLIVGAGISGIGCACHLVRELPGKSWTILESRGDLGGTWDLFRYPGIRSDSDLFTFGYDFRPWKSRNAIASADEIMAYLRDTAAEYGVDEKIRFHHRVISADWRSDEAVWHVTARREDTGETVQLRARWLFGATGYYDYAQGYRPDFEGEESFAGPIIHPQHWPEDFDATGKRIAVIGSGATAVTLVPALAETAAHVTQVQRTPTYVLPVPSEDKIAAFLRKVLPEKTAYGLARRRHVLRQRWTWLVCQKYPEFARRFIRKANMAALPEGFDVDTHFNPPYAPWDQRLCIVPDGDFYRSIRAGKASIVTGGIERFTETGLRMASGEEIEADAIVTATGLNLKLFGGTALNVDGKRVDPAERLVFKGMMLDGVPNFAFAVGYTNSSWTLKVGLLCQYFCRLLAYMDEHEWAAVEARRPEGEMRARPLLDFEAGYVKRALDSLPKQGDGPPWQMTFDYIEDARMVRRGPVADPALHFAPYPASHVQAAE
ncbi:flavin-containing monooxygenase [Lutimaribacter marinistellae]|uniref:Flavin-containing monooxygenase n=1 Tax=Lutimaribacter marinistellae TaxID=1820329 RepID=A0ABV7TI01_9RHOB